MTKLIVYIKKHYQCDIVDDFFNSLFDTIDLQKYLVYVVSDNNETKDIIEKYYDSKKVYKYYNKKINTGIKSAIFDITNVIINDYTILLSSDLYNVQNIALDLLVKSMKDNRNVMSFSNILSNDELCNVKNKTVKFINLNACIFKNTHQNIFYNFNYSSEIEQVDYDVNFIEDSILVKNNKFDSKIIINNKNTYFKPMNKGIYQKLPIKILDMQFNSPPIDKKEIISVKTEEKPVIQHHNKTEIVHQPKIIEYIDINKIYIYTYDANMVNNLKNKLSTLKIDVELIDKNKISSYNFYDSVIINLTDEYMLSFNIVSTCPRCVLITMNSKNNRQYFKENHNAIIVDINDANIYDKILLNINNLKNKSYFNKISKSLYDSYIKYKNYFSEEDIAISKKIRINRNIYRPFPDKKLINQFQIGIVYKEHENHVKDIIEKITTTDNRMKFGLLNNDIKYKNATYYEKNYNMYKKSICSLIFDHDGYDTEYEVFLCVACGCLPIIITEKKNFELIKKDMCLIVDYNDINSLLHIVKTIITDKNKIKNIIEKGYSYLSIILE